jgi:hypothetical protein
VDFVKGSKILDQPSDCQLLKDNTSARKLSSHIAVREQLISKFLGMVSVNSAQLTTDMIYPRRVTTFSV